MNASVIADVLARRDGFALLERDIFGTTDPDRIATEVDGFCRERLGAAVERYEFFATSVGSVYGARLRDGRRIVIKAYRRRMDPDHLRAVQRVQEHLAEGGFPAPRPILAPTPLARGVAIAETLLDDGERVDAHDPVVRLRVASGLAEFIERTRPLAGMGGLSSWRDNLDRLWRQPHDARFDFEGTAAGAEWIDGLAARATRHLDRHPAPCVIGHGDWRTEHLRFAGDTLTAVYDWDSLVLAPEPVLAGVAAHAFTADWSLPAYRCVPTIEESLGFLADYDSVRGLPFTERERGIAVAALVAIMAYSARCEHSDRLTAFGTRPPAPPGGPLSPDGFVAVLAAHGERLLSQAG